jgi:hypothetical protein
VALCLLHEPAERTLAAERLTLGTSKHIGKARALLQSLVPRAQAFSFYDAAGACQWSSDGADDYEVDSFITELPPEVLAEASADSLRRTLKSGRTVFVVGLRDGGDALLGHLVLVFSKNAAKSSWFNPSTLKTILDPALEVVAESLIVEHELHEATDQLAGVERELALVYEMDEQVHGTSRSHSGLASLVGKSGRFLQIAYSVLLIPSKRIRISATHSSWKNVNRKVMDRYLVEQILPRLEGRRARRRIRDSGGRRVGEHRRAGIPDAGLPARRQGRQRRGRARPARAHQQPAVREPAPPLHVAHCAQGRIRHRAFVRRDDGSHEPRGLRGPAH